MHTTRGVIAVSIVSAWCEICIAYTSIWDNSWDSRHIFLDICTSTARWTKQPKLVLDLFSKSIPFVPSRGDASQRRPNTFQIKRSDWKALSSFVVVGLRPHGLVQKEWIYWTCLVQASVTLSTELCFYKYPKICLGSHKLTKTKV